MFASYNVYVDAESGTPLETETQKKKRIEVRPLDYEKGEKNVSGHLNDGEYQVLFQMPAYAHNMTCFDS